MITKQIVLHADFDGTLFDPSIHVLLSPIFNQLTVRLMRKNKALLVVNTGRPIWNWFSNLQLVTTGMKKADVVIAGCGTTIFWKKGISLIKDTEWDMRMQKTSWNKEKVKKALNPLLTKEGATYFDTANPYMMRLWVYNKKVVELERFIGKLKRLLPHTQILLTEQILLPNTTEVFSGYLLFIPSIAGKDKAATYVTEKLEKITGLTQRTIYVGDAYVDVPLLTHDSSPTSFSYGIHPTPLAKESLNAHKVPVILGSPPQIVYRIMKSHLQSNTNEQNSGYRKLIQPFLLFWESRSYKDLTPNQLSMKGLNLVQDAVKHIRPSNTLKLIQGFMLDALDGIRARKHPERATPDGQLIDVFADRMKEYAQLISRKQFDAALSCFLPSIARAQAEAIGEIVPEIDVAGGSSTSRALKLIWSYLVYSLGLFNWSNNIDDRIFQANLASYYNRKKYGNAFDWNKLESYDTKSVTRLLFLIELLHQQLKTTKITDLNLSTVAKEYSQISVNKIKKDLNLSTPHIQKGVNVSIKSA